MHTNGSVLILIIRSSTVESNGTTSSIENIDIGVPQGSCLGPLLFLLYINDLIFALKKAKATMYADDTAISFSSDTSDELDLAINEEHSCIEKWLQSNKLLS